MYLVKRYIIWILVMLIFAVFIRNYEFAYEFVQSGTHIYAYKPWVPVGALLGGIAFSIWIYKSPEPAAWAGTRYGTGPYAASVVCMLTIGFALSLNLQVVELDEDGFVARGRIWGRVWDGSEQRVQFADVERVRMVWDEKRETGSKTNGIRTYYNLLFEQTESDSTELSVNNDVSRLAASHILEIVSERGIPISKPFSADADKWYTRR